MSAPHNAMRGARHCCFPGNNDRNASLQFIKGESPRCRIDILVRARWEIMFTLLVCRRMYKDRNLYGLLNDSRSYFGEKAGTEPDTIHGYNDFITATEGQTGRENNTIVLKNAEFNTIRKMFLFRLVAIALSVFSKEVS
jgi:hypothetical protein